MSEAKSQWLNMTTAFFVSEDYSQKKENAGEFVKWLEGEGYEEVKHENNNLYGAYYIDIASKAYARAHSDAMLAPVVGYQGIKYDDFKKIHNIFKRTSENEKTWRYRPANMTPITLYLSYKEISQKEREEDRQLYFSSNTFEEWCDDVFEAIKSHRWYKKYRPNYSREEFYKSIGYFSVRQTMENLYDEYEMPEIVAAQWEQIIF